MAVYTTTVLVQFAAIIIDHSMFSHRTRLPGGLTIGEDP